MLTLKYLLRHSTTITEGTFRPERIVAIAERFGVDANAVLDNISVARVHTSEQQIDALSNAGK